MRSRAWCCYPLVRNIQASWVKLGPEWAQRCLTLGANDLGGTLMNESISRAAGAMHGQEFAPVQMQQLIGALGRPWRQRTTLYAQCRCSKHRARIARGAVDGDVQRTARPASFCSDGVSDAPDRRAVVPADRWVCPRSAPAMISSNCSIESLRHAPNPEAARRRCLRDRAENRLEGRESLRRSRERRAERRSARRSRSAVTRIHGSSSWSCASPLKSCASRPTC